MKPMIWVLTVVTLLLSTGPVKAQRRRGGNNSAQRARQQQQARQRQQQSWLRQQQAWEAEQRRIEQEMQRGWETKGRAEWQKNTLDELDTIVTLTPEQKTKLEPIVAEELKQLEALPKQRLSSSGERARSQEIYSTAWDRAFALLTPAQKQKIDERGQDKILDQLTKSVGLDKGQKTQVCALLYDEIQRSYAVRDNKKLSEDEKVEAKCNINRELWAKTEQLLTPEQLKKLNAARRAQVLTGLRRTLVLSADQCDKIGPLMEEAALQNEALTGDSLLSAEELTSKRKAINGAMWDKITPLLSPWQKQKAAEIRGVSVASPTGTAPSTGTASPTAITGTPNSTASHADDVDETKEDG